MYKADTGAEVTAVSDTAFGTMRKQTLKAPTKDLYGPARTALNVLGQFEGELSYYMLHNSSQHSLERMRSDFFL